MKTSYIISATRDLVLSTCPGCGKSLNANLRGLGSRRNLILKPKPRGISNLTAIIP